MIKYNSERFKLLIIYYNNSITQDYKGRQFAIRIKPAGSYSLFDIKKMSISSYTVKLLFINTKHNIVMEVDYTDNYYFNYEINLDPKLNYFIE